MDEEIWKDIPDYEGLYEASSHGRIRSKEGRVSYGESKTNGNYQRVLKSRILKEKKSKTKNKRRDMSVDLWKDKKPHTLRVARLIALTFIPNPENKSQVNHIDGNFRNNRVDNLEWTTGRENMSHAFENDLMGTNKKIKLIDINDNYYEFISFSKASKFLDRSHGYVSCAIKRHKNELTSKNGEKYTFELVD